MNWLSVLNALIFAVLGLVVFCLGFVAIDKLTPYNLWQELVEKRNTALALVVGFVSLGICLIIAAAIHG
jgi:uncharacterized membrane protein YjfL (UPF0719 family)